MGLARLGLARMGLARMGKRLGKRWAVPWAIAGVALISLARCVRTVVAN